VRGVGLLVRQLVMGEGRSSGRSFGTDEYVRVADRGARPLVFHSITLALALLTLLQVDASAETRSSPAQIWSVSRAGDETWYVLSVRSEKGDDMRRILATKKGSPCEGFFGGDEVAAVYDVNVVTLTAGSRTCRLDVQEISPQGGADGTGTTRGRGRLQRQVP
jgi:hypothetical protein